MQSKSCNFDCMLSEPFCNFAAGNAGNFMTMVGMLAPSQRPNNSIHSWSKHSQQQSDIDSIAVDGRDLATPANWQHALSVHKTKQLGKTTPQLSNTSPQLGNAAPLPAYLQTRASAPSPPSPQYSPSCEVDYTRQLRHAIHATPDKHPAAPEVSSPVQSCALTSWNSAPEPTLNPRSAKQQSSAAMPAPTRQQATPFAAEANQDYDAQRPARRQSSSSAARFNPLHPSRQQHRLSPSSSLPSRGAFAAASTPSHAGFAQLHQPGMRLASSHPSDLAVTQLDATMDLHPADTEQVSSDLSRNTGHAMVAQTGDSVPITPQHRRAWDWSHGSLQSFRQALKHQKQQRIHTGSLQQGRSKHHRPPAKPPSKSSQSQHMLLQPGPPSSSQVLRRQAVSLTHSPEQLLPSSHSASPVPAFFLSPAQHPAATSLSASCTNPHFQPQHAPFQTTQSQPSSYQTPAGTMQQQPQHPKVNPPPLLSSLACQPVPTPALQSPQQPVHRPMTPVPSSSPDLNPAPLWSTSKCVQSLGGPPWTQWSQALQISKGMTASEVSRAVEQVSKPTALGTPNIHAAQQRSNMTACDFFRSMHQGSKPLPGTGTNSDSVMSQAVEPLDESMHGRESEAPIDELDQATLVWMAGNLASADDHSDMA